MSQTVDDTTVLIAQLTDTHVVASGTDQELYVDNNGRLADAVAAINAETPAMAAVLATGDMTNWGHAVEYEMLGRLLEPLVPRILPIPGNHDERDRMRELFPDVPWVDAAHASWVASIGHVRVVGLDSTLPGAPGAEFDEQRESWLRSILEQAHDGPTLLALHHPPFETGIAWMDRSGFIGLDRLAVTLTDHPVDRVLCGHMHRPISSTIAGIPAQVGMSTVQHVDLGLAPDAPVTLVRDPVGYQILRVVDREIVVHARYIDTGEEPFEPSWGPDYR